MWDHIFYKNMDKMVSIQRKATKIRATETGEGSCELGCVLKCVVQMFYDSHVETICMHLQLFLKGSYFKLNGISTMNQGS